MPEEIEISRVIDHIKRYSSYDFSDYSEKSFARRIEKILVDNSYNLDQFLNRLSSDAQFLEHTVREITVNTTELFRDIDIWHAIRYRILPKLKHQDEIRIWHAGCSTGQEVYSMAILLWELDLYHKAKILATDLNTLVLARAQKGEYQYRFNQEYLESFNKVMRFNPYNYDDVLTVPDEKYLIINRANDTLSLQDFLKKNIEFRKHDLVKLDSPWQEPFDIIICRNVLIYFNSTLQNRVIESYYQKLNARGYLILGKHESLLGTVANKFNKRGNFYTKKNII